MNWISKYQAGSYCLYGEESVPGSCCWVMLSNVSRTFIHSVIRTSELRVISCLAGETAVRLTRVRYAL